jgi:hypothetical protein
MSSLSRQTADPAKRQRHPNPLPKYRQTPHAHRKNQHPQTNAEQNSDSTYHYFYGPRQARLVRCSNQLSSTARELGDRRAQLTRRNPATGTRGPGPVEQHKRNMCPKALLVVRDGIQHSLDRNLLR